MSFKLKLTSLFNIYNNNNAPLSSQTTAEKDTTFLFQRLSVALPRGNAISFLGIFPSVAAVILQLLIISKPAASCLWVQKLIIITQHWSPRIQRRWEYRQCIALSCA